MRSLVPRALQLPLAMDLVVTVHSAMSLPISNVSNAVIQLALDASLQTLVPVQLALVDSTLTKDLA